ncbi:MAG: metallophosphoesterase [Actinomycetota bacterium]|nr:metallophosphoesterase [Actinomycetota bacterium]
MPTESSDELGRAKPAGSAPPARPAEWSKLKFRPANATRWFAPNVLADAGLRVAIASAFGAFLDKRELQKAVVPDSSPQPIEPTEEPWFDFISDTGDGFDPTYTIAWLAARPELDLSNGERRLPRGKIVVLGGDEVYPVGSPEAYENKFWRPYEAALPWLERDNPHLYAVPGNHDWYDGLTSFFRVFGQNNWIGGRCTPQTRSYFAIQLPHGWWLWGIDIQLDSYIDKPQQEYFESVALQEGDKVILCTATPSWYERNSQAYKNLQWVERTLIIEHGARLVLTLSGDSHHYAHYVGEDGTHKITAGGGGAFLHPTHDVDKNLCLPMGMGTKSQDFEQRACYPSRRGSRLRALGAIALPVRNPTFMFLPAVLYALLGWASQFSLRPFGSGAQSNTAVETYGWREILVGLFQSPVSVLLLVLVGLGMVGFAKPSTSIEKKRQNMLTRGLMAASHLAFHVAAVVGVGFLAMEVAALRWDGGWQFTLRFVFAMALLGAVVGSLVTGVYLGLWCALFKAHGNEAYSAMRIEGFKNFLRLHLDENGVLTVYPVGVRRANTRWKLDPDQGPEASWIAPLNDRHRPVAHLIEDPFTVG